MRLLAVLALAFATGVAACGGEAAHTASWNGPQRPYPADGVLEVDEFRSHADAVDEDWERDPEALAREFAQVRDGSATVEGGRVTLLRDSLEDDSVRAERYLLELERDGDAWKLVSARWEQRCHERRGHQDFTPELCI